MTFLPGDHIFIRRGGLAGKSLIKHHAIVVATLNANEVEIVEHGVYNKDGTKKWVAGTAMDVLHKEPGQVKRRTIDLKAEPGWEAAVNLKDAFHPAAVVERAVFLLSRGEALLPAYHLTYCNGECVARWCKTGTFESAQASKLYDKVNNANTKVAGAMDTSGNAVSRAIAPASPSRTTNQDNNAVGSPKAPVPTIAILPNSPMSPPTSPMKNKLADTQAVASSTMKLATSKVVDAVMAVGTMVGNRQQEVFEKWTQTNEILDAAFIQEKSKK